MAQMPQGSLVAGHVRFARSLAPEDVQPPNLVDRLLKDLALGLGDRAHERLVAVLARAGVEACPDLVEEVLHVVAGSHAPTPAGRPAASTAATPSPAACGAS